jgi:hypothetical protein
MTDTSFVMPAFVFHRRRHVELEAGFILAGQLIVDIPKTKKPKERDRRMVMKIIQQLTAEAQSGRMPIDGLIFGWHGGVKPPNAVDTNDDAIMSAWADRSMIIGVRVDPRPNDGSLRLDSDALAQMGLLKHNS